MSRTISIRSIRKVTEEEADRYSKMSLGEIFRNYEEIFSLMEGELDSGMYTHMECYLTPIKTKGANTVYVARCEFCWVGSDALVAKAIESLVEYKQYSYKEITELSGTVLRAGESFWNAEEKKYDVRSIEFPLPEAKEGCHLFFMDDME